MKNITIIGAGILGASAAYHASKHPGVAVTVIDQIHPGQATDAAAGIICPWISQRRNKAWYSLAKAGAAYYPTLIAMLESDGETETGYRQTGAISLHTDVTKLEKMVERATLRKQDAPEIGEIKHLSTEETSALFPPVDGDFQSVYISGAARVNGRELRSSLLRAAQRNGASFIEGTAVVAKAGTDSIVVSVNEEPIDSDCIIIAAGVWARELLKPLQLDFQVTSQKAQIVHMQLGEKETEHWPVVMPPTNQYIVPFDHGKIVMGATHEDDHPFDLRVTVGGLHEILQKCLSIAPGLAEGSYEETRVGFRPFTPGFLPVIGQIPGYEGVYTANGLGASGLTVGPFLGAQLAKMALNQNLDIHLEMYDLNEAINPI